MFDNDNPSHRQSLVDALQEKGMDAFEWDSGGGITHVIVPLLSTYDEPIMVATGNPTLRSEIENFLHGASNEAFLYIATNSLQTPCEIVVIGAYGDSDRQFSSNMLKAIHTLEEAVLEFEGIWDNRDKWLKEYLGSSDGS